jgi:hypothetical protein
VLQQGGQYADEVKQALIDVVGLYPPGTYVQLDNGEVAVVLRRGKVWKNPRLPA